MKDDKPTDETNVFKCLSDIANDKVYLGILEEQKGIITELKGTMSEKQIDLFARYQEATNRLRNHVKHKNWEMMSKEISKFEDFI